MQYVGMRMKRSYVQELLQFLIACLHCMRTVLVHKYVYSTCTITNVQTYKLADFPFLSTYLLTYTCACKQVRVGTYLHTRTCVHAYLPACISTYICTLIHTFMHACIHREACSALLDLARRWIPKVRLNMLTSKRRFRKRPSMVAFSHRDGHFL